MKRQDSFRRGESPRWFADTAGKPSAVTDFRIGGSKGMAMKFAALALDYDGTIAIDGAFDPAVRAAIGDLRRRGIVVILVTGRRLDDLRRVAGDVS